MSDVPLLVVVLFGMGYLAARVDSPVMPWESIRPFEFAVWMVLGTSVAVVAKLAVSGTLHTLTQLLNW